MKTLVALVVSLTLFGCGCGKLRPDPVMSSIEAGYPSAELLVGGQVFLGLKETSIKSGEDLSSLNASIKTYFNGVVRIDGCGIGISKSYLNSEVISFGLSGPATDSCVVAYTIAPSYPKQSNGSIVVHPLRGYLSIRVIKPDQDLITGEYKVSGNFSKNINFMVGGSSARAFFSGCGIDYDEDITLSFGVASLDLANLVENKIQTCVLEGVFISPEYKDLFVSILVSRYNKEFTPLAIPSISDSGRKICIKADPATSIISIDGKYIVSDHGCFKNKVTNGSIIRAVTVKGRTVIGIYDNEWKWQQ